MFCNRLPVLLANDSATDKDGKQEIHKLLHGLHLKILASQVNVSLHTYIVAK